jgi:hydroxymethylpyrimidine pyrophosphatase-like HAD family hydrolase
MLPEQKIRLVAVDVDGTLVGRDSLVAEPVREALARARGQGCEVVLCTGRSRRTTIPVWEQIAASPVMIVFGGAVVLNHLTGEVFYRAALTPDVVEPAVHLMRAAGLGPMAFRDGLPLPTKEGTQGRFDGAMVERRCPPWPKWVELNPGRMEWVADLTAELTFDPVVISAMGPPGQIVVLADTLRAKLGGRVGVTLSVSLRYEASCLEVRSIASDKGRALRAVAEHFGVPRKAVMAIGDYLNDLEMIEYAGLGVAMGDSPPELQARADAVTGTLAEHGVAQAVERWVLRDG